ncbi:hypothetical protein POM88_012949 [Heracleum sosnowskyi]|uniref:Pentatricopeptide repeat-containing protein n=1 Tax=Heracleum sosnowskyi TaxID=360622 RepID=A0AAD8IZ02_9APIA|nr:hypothetical protein POM88_012949 [Heracleum sosnowskyi]
MLTDLKDSMDMGINQLMFFFVTIWGLMDLDQSNSQSSNLFGHPVFEFLSFFRLNGGASMSEAQRRPLVAAVGRNNGYINGVVPLRSPSTVSEIDEFCFALGGKKPIHSILIANNGMAAVKLSGLYMSAGICGDHNHPTGLNVALAFDMDYARWLEEHQRLSFYSILSACAELSALILGREIHGHVIRGSLDSNVLVGNGLANMYTKCGSVREGNLVFEKIIGKDTYSWNTMIAGYDMHGLGEKALQTFNRMIESGFERDGVTFVACLSSCSHAGLVNKGREIFDQMEGEFKFEPQLEHYSCMVDLLGRAGFLNEAYNMVKTMAMEPNICVLGALLNSCSMYKNTDGAQDIASLMYNHNSAMTGS